MCTVSAVGFCSEVVAAAAVGVAAGAGGVATCNSAAGIRSSQQASTFERLKEAGSATDTQR